MFTAIFCIVVAVDVILVKKYIYIDSLYQTTNNVAIDIKNILRSYFRSFLHTLAKGRC